MLAVLRNIFSPQAIVQTLTTMAPVASTFRDKLFPDSPTHPLPMLGVADLKDIAQTVPMVRRDGTPVNLGTEELEAQFIAPLPVKVKVNVTASQLNDLKAILQQPQAVEAWRTRQIDRMRRAINHTVEAVCSIVATTGKVSWPVQLEGGNMETYMVDYGPVLTYTPPALLTATSPLSALYNLLRLMAEQIQQSGAGGKIEYMAGSDVVGVLLDIAENSRTTTEKHPYRLELETDYMKIGASKIAFMHEKYPSPLNSADWLPKLDPKTLMAVAVDQPGKVFFCAIDSISANNAAVPLHVTPVLRDDDTGVTLIANTKPLPVRPSRASCKAVVVA